MSEEIEIKQDNYKIISVLKPLFSSNVFLIMFGENGIIFDTAHHKSRENLLKKLKEMKIDLSKVLLIVPSHSHFDHCGGLSVLKKECVNAKVIVHEKEVDYVKRGTSIPLIGTKAWDYESVVPDIEMKNERLILNEYGFNDDCFLLHTPGHSVGSVSLICGKEAFVGDLIVNRKMIFRDTASFYKDLTKETQKILFKSWKTLIDLNIETFYPGHGEKLTREEVLKIYEKYNPKTEE